MEGEGTEGTGERDGGREGEERKKWRAEKREEV